MLNELAHSIFLANQEKGFWDKERNVGEMLMLVTSELGEAMEAHRKNKFSSWEKFEELTSKVEYDRDKIIDNKPFELTIKDTFEDEIADAIIRLLDMAGGLKIDIDKQIKAKLEYNKSRQKFHGKAY